MDDVAVTEAVDQGAEQPDWHRRQAIECNNSCWDLIEADRSPDDDEDLLRRAYAAAYHWQRAAGATPANEVRALYMLGKVHVLIGLPDRGLHYAEACYAACVHHGLADFDLAYAHEILARALHACGRTDEAETEWKQARSVPVADPQDREILEADLAGGL